MTLSSFPDEILGRVFQYLEPRDRKALMRVNKQCQRAVEFFSLSPLGEERQRKILDLFWCLGTHAKGSLLELRREVVSWQYPVLKQEAILETLYGLSTSRVVSPVLQMSGESLWRKLAESGQLYTGDCFASWKQFMEDVCLCRLFERLVHQYPFLREALEVPPSVVPEEALELPPLTVSEQARRIRGTKQFGRYLEIISEVLSIAKDPRDVKLMKLPMHKRALEILGQKERFLRGRTLSKFDESILQCVFKNILPLEEEQISAFVEALLVQELPHHERGYLRRLCHTPELCEQGFDLDLRECSCIPSEIFLFKTILRKICFSSELLMQEEFLTWKALSESFPNLAGVTIDQGEYSREQISRGIESILREQMVAPGQEFLVAFLPERKNEAFGFVLVQKNGHVLQFLSPDLRRKKEVVSAACHQNGLSLAYASEEMQDDGEVVQVAFEQNAFSATNASKRLLRDPKFVRKALQKDGSLLQFFLLWQDNEEMVQLAYQSDPSAINYASLRVQDLLGNPGAAPPSVPPLGTTTMPLPEEEFDLEVAAAEAAAVAEFLRTQKFGR